MSLITKVKLKNFKSFRADVSVDLLKSSYLIGVNNAGKTSILQGIQAFFEDSIFSDGSFLNKSEFTRKQAGYNRSEITLTFDLNAIVNKTRKSKLIRKHGGLLNITKISTFTPESGVVSISWQIDGETFSELPADIKWLFTKIKITYIHPQEGQQLLENVLKRLKQRLLANWGRGATLTHTIDDLEAKWAELRIAANRYLSQSLTDSLQVFWPECSVAVDLPKKVRDIMDVSDINFQGNKVLPEIKLSLQGAGAQSTILYLANYLLDSDRSLNRGEYHPIWLMEEPESFLHADLLVKLAQQINSPEWLKSIQMVISTHSPILLASSRHVNDDLTWIILEDSKVIEMIEKPQIEDNKIAEIGKLMGDQNFLAYFTVSQKGDLIFIEDSRSEVKQAFERASIPIEKGLNGVTDILRFIKVFEATPGILRSPVYFIIDADRGKNHLGGYLESQRLIGQKRGFKKFKVSGVENLFLILLPEDEAVEDLFEEYKDHLVTCKSKLVNVDFSLKENTPTDLTRAMSKLRSASIQTEEELYSLIKNEQDVKDLFWCQVSQNDYKIASEKSNALRFILKIRSHS